MKLIRKKPSNVGNNEKFISLDPSLFLFQNRDSLKLYSINLSTSLPSIFSYNASFGPNIDHNLNTNTVINSNSNT